MRVDKYTMAQSWMRQDDATPEEAKATWDTLETEFEDKRKSWLMASAETDEIIKTINDKFGPGTMFPASEAPIPPMTDQQAIMEFNERNPYSDGQLVTPSVDGSRPGYAGDDVTYTKKWAEDRYNTVKDINSLKLNKEKVNLKTSDFKTGKMLYPDDKGQKYVQQYLDSVQKGYLNNDMSKVTRFKTFIKNKYPKTFAKVLSDVNSSGYRGIMDIGVDYKRKLANEIITASNNQLKYINQFDIIKKLVPANRAAQVKDTGINSLGNLLDENTLNAFRKLDKMEDKLSKSLTYIVDNDVKILDPSKIKIKGSAAAGYQTQSPIKKMMNYLAGGGSRKQLNKALEQNKWYQSQNYKVGKTIRNTFDDLSQAYSTDFIGQNFNDAYDYALNRRGSVSVKGMSKKITPERLIWSFAARSADRHFKDLEDPKDWLVKIVDKNGDVIDYSNLPVDDKGRRIIDTNKYQFLYKGQTFNKNNLNTKGYKSGLFNDVYKATNQITDYLNTDVPDPDNPKKTISLGELFEKTEGRIFASIGHDDAKGGVKKKPFNTFKILTNVENQALYNAYDKIKSPAVRKQVVDFIYGQTDEGNPIRKLRGERYKKAWIDKNVPFITEYIKTGQGLEQTPYKQALTMSNEEQMKVLKQMGYRCRKASGAGETLECYLDDVEETKAQARKGDPTAIKRQKKAFDVAAELPKIGKLVRQGVQAGAAGLATAFKWTGLGSPIGYAIEGAIEKGVYDYYRGKGYNHEQAMAETLIPGLVKGRPEDVPWYGGAEKLIEKEKIGTRWDPSGKVNLAAKYADAKSKYDAALDKYNFINASMTTYANVADWEKDLNAQAKILKDLEPSIKRGTPEYEAYQTADERQTALMDQRARDYKSKNRFLGWEWDLSPAQIKQQTPSDFKEEDIRKQRYRDMDKYKTTSWGDPMEAYSLKPGERFNWDAVGFGGEQGIKDKWQQIYEIGGMDLLDKIGIAGGVSKMSNGGIAGVKKVDPDELKEAQEKMKKLMKQYKNKNLDWDAVKRSYKIWTK